MYFNVINLEDNDTLLQCIGVACIETTEAVASVNKNKIKIKKRSF